MKTVDFWSGDEWIPVEVLTKNTGILKESSVNPEYCYNDMVLIDFENKEITQVIKKSSQTFIITYDVPYNNYDEDWAKVKSFFEKENYHIQQHAPGVCFVALPLSFSYEQFKGLIDRCPIKCFELTKEEIYNSDGDDEEDDEDSGLFHLN